MKTYTKEEILNQLNNMEDEDIVELSRISDYCNLFINGEEFLDLFSKEDIAMGVAYGGYYPNVRLVEVDDSKHFYSYYHITQALDFEDFTDHLYFVCNFGQDKDIYLKLLFGSDYNE